MGKRITHDWEPLPDDTLEGVLIDAMTVEGTRWGDVPVAVIRKRDSRTLIGVWQSRTMLKNLFDEQRPALGSKIVIHYDGTGQSKVSGRSYHKYAMRTETSMSHTGNDWITDITTKLENRKQHTST